MRRTCTIGILALVLAIGAHTPAGRHLIGSVQNFQRQFDALQSAHSIGSIERLVLSLAMTS